MPSEKLEKVVMKPFKMDPAQNNSQQELVTEDNENQRGMRSVSFREWIVVAILCFVNLINYMDRFTVAGVLEKVQNYYHIDNKAGGFLQTAFILSYMLFAPIFGYLGDRYNRRYIMSFGVFIWSITTLCGSFMTNFYWFVCFRAVVGIGEASYSTIAPTIIGDYFTGDVRSKMLAIFYFAIPVGSGLGYIIGSKTAELFGQWQWALRVTPPLGFVAVIFIIFILTDPERGQSECSGHMETTPWLEDQKYLIHNPSFMYSTAGFTCVAFVAGALSWWGPLFIEKGMKLQSSSLINSEEDVAYKFGVISMLSGLIGVPLGSFVAQQLRSKYRRIDANICAFGLLMSSPLVFLVAITARQNAALCFTLVFFAELFLNLTWSIIADILLYVVLPTRRSSAEGFQLLFSHAFGDAGSPYFIGVLSEVIKSFLQQSNANSTNKYSELEIEFTSLQYALFSTCFVEVLGGIFFIITAFYIVKDKKKVDDTMHGARPSPNQIEQEEQLQADL